MIKVNKIIEVLFGVLIVLHASGFFRFFSVTLGIPVGLFTFMSLIICILYLFYNIKTFSEVYNKQHFLNWVLILLIWPLFTILYSPNIDIKNIARLLFFVFLFSASLVYFIKNGSESIRKVIGISILIAITGGVLSVIFPKMFIPTLIEAGHNQYMYMLKRAFGFDLQANRLACNTSLMFIVWFALQKWNNHSIKIMITSSLLFAFILLTGSRTGMVISLIIIILILLNSLRYKHSFIKRIKNYFTLLSVVLVFIISIATFVVSAYPESSLAERLSWMSRIKAEKITDDNSKNAISFRLEAQLKYLNMTIKRPWGYGFGSDRFYLDNGTLKMTAHSEVLTTAFQYSLLYPFLVVFFMAMFMKKSKRRMIEKRIGTTIFLQFFIVFVLLYAYAQGTLISRAFFVSFAAIYSMFYYSKLFFSNYDK